ncbi:MAG: family 16 glycoside hydrolase [Pirellula sp.]
MNFSRSANCIPILIAILFPISFASAQEAKKTNSDNAVAIKDGDKKAKWKTLLEPDSLKGWEITNFGGEGTVDRSEGVLKLGIGDPLTGITLKSKDFPKENYELQWKANRVEGSDFLAGVTFPVGNEHCSFIAGGWGGGLVGLSSINGNDASENETASFHNFKNKQWYSFRVRVDKTHITAWIDDKEVAHVEREPGKFSLRAEVLKSRPLGYCAFQSVVEVKDWEYRVLE